jgi:hypothetical protein
MRKSLTCVSSCVALEIWWCILHKIVNFVTNLLYEIDANIWNQCILSLNDVWQHMSKTTSSSSNRRLLNVKVCLKLGRTTLWSSFGNPSDKPNELKWVSENMFLHSAAYLIRDDGLPLFDIVYRTNSSKLTFIKHATVRTGKNALSVSQCSIFGKVLLLLWYGTMSIYHHLIKIVDNMSR